MPPYVEAIESIVTEAADLDAWTGHGEIIMLNAATFVSYFLATITAMLLLGSIAVILLVAFRRRIGEQMYGWPLTLLILDEENEQDVERSIQTRLPTVPAEFTRISIPNEGLFLVTRVVFIAQPALEYATIHCVRIRERRE